MIQSFKKTKHIMEIQKIKNEIHDGNPISLISSALDRCRELQITGSQALLDADSLMQRLSFFKNQIDKRRLSLTLPYREAVSSINNYAKSVTDKLDNARRDLLAKKSEYVRQIEAEKRRQAEIAAAEITKKQSVDDILQSAKNLVNHREIPADVRKITYRKEIIFTEYDFKKIPEKYLIINESLIKSDIKAGIKIPGIKYKIDEVAVR